MESVLEEGGSQARVMNLVEVITASRLEGAEGVEESTDWRLELLDPSNETGLLVVTVLESAEHKKTINKKNSCKINKNK